MYFIKVSQKAATYYSFHSSKSLLSKQVNIQNKKDNRNPT